MTKQSISNTPDEEKGGISFATAATVTGAVVGLGAVVAGVVALQDKRNQKIVTSVLTNAKHATDVAIENIEHTVDRKKEEVVALAKKITK